MLGSSRTVALASIGSGSVSVGIAHGAAGKPPSIVAAERLVLPLEERTQEQTIAALKQRLIDAGSKVLAAYTSTRAGRPVSAVYAFIRAPWAQSRTVRAEVAYDHEEYISETTITDLAKRALEDAHAPRANFLEASLMQVALNGYPTTQPEGKYAHKAEIAVLVCAADPSLRVAVQEALGNVFPASPAVMHSSARSILEALRERDQKRRDCLVLDVGEEGTAAIVMRGSVAESEMYVAEGIRSMLLRALPNRPPEDTLVTMGMMAREECEPAVCNSMEGALAKMEPDLAHVFGEFFAAIGTPLRLPSTITLLTHPDLAVWLTRFFSRIDFAQFTEISQPFEVITFSPQTLSHETAKAEPSQQKQSAGTSQATPPVINEKHESTDTDLALALALINKQEGG